MINNWFWIFFLERKIDFCISMIYDAMTRILVQMSWIWRYYFFITKHFFIMFENLLKTCLFVIIYNFRYIILNLFTFYSGWPFFKYWNGHWFFVVFNEFHCRQYFKLSCQSLWWTTFCFTDYPNKYFFEKQKCNCYIRRFWCSF